MEWLLQEKDGKAESTLEDFNDLMKQRHESKFKEGGMSRLTAFHVKENGLAPLITDSDVKDQIDKLPAETDNNIRRLQEIYGQAQLEELKPHEFYALYKKHSTGLGSV